MENYNIINTAFNISLDIGSIVMSVMMSIYFFKNENTSKESRYFFWLSILNSIFVLADLSGWIFNKFARSWYPMVFTIGRFVYYAVTAVLFLLLLKYVIAYISSFGKVSKIYMRMGWLLACLHLLGCMITPFTGFYYSITEENMYRFGNGIWCFNILPIAVLSMISILAFRFRKILPLRAVATLFGFVGIVVLGQIVKILLDNVFSVNPPITLAIVVMFFHIQFDKDMQLKKDRQELEELNTKIMLSQIQPHFLYNTLATIRGLCETNPVMAKELINDFSIFLKANMDSLTTNILIPFEQELLQVKSYLNIAQQMYGENLQVVYDIQATQFFIPTLSIQPIVENAVHKGIRKKENGGILVIHTEEDEQYFHIIISDNGIGFDKNILKEDGHIGIQNVQKRLYTMCKGILEIETTLGKGTTVHIKIPKISGRDGRYEIFDS